MKKLFVLLVVLSSNVFAEDAYTPYLKLGGGYILSKPENITVHTNNKEGQKVDRVVDLYTNDNILYFVETGISVPMEHNNTFTLGIYYTDLFNQGETKKLNRPYRFKVFADKQYNYSELFYTKLGVGFKVIENTRINVVGVDNNYVETENTPILDRITLRLAVGKRFGNFDLSLEHHSQIFQGKPFNDDWEFHTTSVNLAYIF